MANESPEKPAQGRPREGLSAERHHIKAEGGPKGLRQTPGHTPRARVHSNETPDRRTPRDQDTGDGCKTIARSERTAQTRHRMQEGGAEARSKSRLRSCS